jgi:hypothetical protein
VFCIVLININIFTGAALGCGLGAEGAPAPPPTPHPPTGAYIIGTMTLVVTRADEETGRYRKELAALKQYSVM